MAKKKTADELRAAADRMKAEAERIEAEELLAERMKDAKRIPTCPNCGGRRFKIDAWTLVSQSIVFPDDPGPDDDHDSCDWDDDYESGDHTELHYEATCTACDAVVDEVLEAFGWTFYTDPVPNVAKVPA